MYAQERPAAYIRDEVKKNMPVPIDLQEIQGAVDLHNWFGYWPTFHDAEIISVWLNREGISSLRVHTWEMTKDLDEKGYYVLTKHVVVEFVFEAVSGLSLNDFNHQNVVFGLGIEKIDSGFRLTLHQCYGLVGNIDAEKLSLHLIPGQPS